MYFQQLAAIIPVFESIETIRSSLTVASLPHTHILIVVLRGHVVISSRGQEPVVFTQGYACHPARGPYAVQVPKTKEAEYAVITYRVHPEDNEWTLHGPLRTVSEVKIKYMLDELLRTIRDIEVRSPQEEAAQSVRKRLIMERILFIYLYETYLKQSEKSSALTMEESLSYLNEHYMLKLTLPMLAQRAGMSVGHYTVLFKKHTGVTMTHYLRRVRIEKAKQMFEQTHLPAKEIAQRVGFVDYFHFSRIFKQEVGCSPTAFQKKLQSNI
ncbi:HTH-type transcriptional activator Btr [Paenibacillus solanacearum]|uniref:HTH-type transcriptional activator Btr n=1 Tax=Paenibacillus solanacearum TaxID=2048548 RepID=A0A916NL61_9BACL|nr:AraC family transcriptional regulator [Paenibacillus solanacearum]CAG7648609.1 HTH-type transcriptional activator Btr [Paenibacillus solanacearum]